MVADSPADAQARPVLRVVRGEPTAAELAALVVALRARSAPAVAPARPRLARWAARDGMLGLPPAPGPGAWRASGLPG